MINSKLDESVFDALFGQAVIDNFNEQLDLLTHDADIEPQLIFSSEHKKRMKLLFAKENRKDKLRKTVKWSKRIAAVILIGISVLFGSLMLVPEARAVIVGTVVEWFDQFTRFTSTAPEAERKHYEPQYIPDGFWEDYRDSNKFTTVIFYINNDDVDIFFESNMIAAQLSVNNIGKEYEIIRIDGIDYHLLKAVDSDAENSIVWDFEGQRYLLSSPITIDELLKIAFSVR